MVQVEEVVNVEVLVLLRNMRKVSMVRVYK